MTHFYQLWMTFMSDCRPDREGAAAPERVFAPRHATLACAVLLGLAGCSGLTSKPSHSSLTATPASASASQANAGNAPNTAVQAPPTANGTPPVNVGPTGPNTNAGPTLPAFDAVTKGAEKQDGFIPIWRKQDKVLFEISPELLNKPLFLSPKLATGLGENGLFGGLMQSRWAQMGKPQWVEFRKVQQSIQLVAINAAFTAKAGTPAARSAWPRSRWARASKSR